jgi:hypothetical protein
MAHFAELDENNNVKRIIVVSDEYESDGEEWCSTNLGGIWKQTSYNHKIRKQFAGIGYKYDEVNDVFVSPSPFSSWVLNDTFDWEPPTPRPLEGFWIWDEETLSWVEINLEETA